MSTFSMLILGLCHVYIFYADIGAVKLRLRLCSGIKFEIVKVVIGAEPENKS